MNYIVTTHSFFAPLKGASKTLEVFDPELNRYVAVAAWWGDKPEERKVLNRDLLNTFLAAGHRIPVCLPDSGQ